MIIKAKTVELRDSGVFILWEDEHESLYPQKFLRASCRCANCIDERSGRRVVDVDAIPEDIQALDWLQVGNYAVQFLWSDAHVTGIYPFELLRQLCPCESCSAARAHAQ